MRRQTRNTLLLLVAVVALAGVAWWQVRRETAVAWQPLATLDANGVQAITVRCDGCPSRRFQYAQGRWWMREPYDLVANDEAMQRLLAIANAPVRKRLVADALDARKIGLDPPQATLTFEGATPMQLQFGRTEAINGDRYVRIGGELSLVPDRFSGWLFAPPESELDRHVVPVAATLREVRIDGQARADLLGAWSRAQASRVIAAPQASPPPAARLIELTIADQAEPLRFRLSRGDAGYLLQREIPALVFVLDEAAMQQLLPPL